MILGYCGTHRSGKTTLAKAMADRLGLPFVGTSVSKCFADLGLHPANVNNAIDRQRVQDHILITLEDQWNEHSDFVTDRTPLDLMAYTLTSGHLLVDDQWLEDYMELCGQLMRKFHVIGYVPPGLPIVEAELKAALTQVSIRQVAFLIRGLLDTYTNTESRFIIPSLNIYHSLERRINYSLASIDSYRQAINEKI
ncbi:AAA family ATPase [Achromobacter phage Motura]|uniref:AAA family ATPase n=1 Tax=Achromobacter phage Motura TaxID=2591403 RepID=A0A514CSE2_9CAUD|nr:thymidylate kinase [Achromobacter phage Motura]QDH83398.1 AAA family ATPase [Achromobacter phage Motura]